jgi:hypothetical protein
MLPELNALFEEKKAPKNVKKCEKTGKNAKKAQPRAAFLYIKYKAHFILYYIYIIILFIARLNLLINSDRCSCTISSSRRIFFVLVLPGCMALHSLNSVGVPLKNFKARSR